MKTVLNNIKEHRKLLGLSLLDVAKRGGISKSMVQRVESGKSMPSQLIMVLISKGIGLPVQDVFNLDWESADFQKYR